MSATYPLAIVNAASVTSLVRMTPHHHSIGVYPAQVETNEDRAALGEKARNAAAENPVTQFVSDIPGRRSVKDPRAIEEAKSK